MEKKTKRNIIAAVAAFIATFALIAVLCPAQAALVDYGGETPSIVLPAIEDPAEPIAYKSKAKPILLGIRKDGSYVVGKMVGGRMVAVVEQRGLKR